MSWNPYGSYSRAPQGFEDESIPLSYPLNDLGQVSHETIEEVVREQHRVGDPRIPANSQEPWASNYPVPHQVSSRQSHLSEENPEEVATLRYTAVVDDANDFTLKNGYDLRPRAFNRHTELMVGITYYNEEKALLCRTLHSTIEACRRMQSLRKSQFWDKGGPAWQKIVVCIIFDGLDAADPGALDTLAAIGLFRHGLLKKSMNGKPVSTHVFEYSTQLSITENLEIGGPESSRIPGLDGQRGAPIQFILVLKNENCGKLNSYRWLYNSVSRILNPEVVVHLDTGTKIELDAVLKVWERFYNNKDLGGICGELQASLGGSWTNILNPLVAAQIFEYKVGFQLDRTFEAATGYLALLPGAFSAWRFRGQMGKPLEDTLLGDPTFTAAQTESSQKPWNLNRYLADDRVICFQVVSKAGQKWVLEYDSSSKAKTDIPMNTTDFINQRRRWLNGAFFSTIYVITHWNRLYKSGHNIVRLAAFHLQLFHSILALILAWFSLAAFLLTTFAINDIAGDPPEGKPISGFPFGKATPVVNGVIQIIYLATILFQFILALGSRPKNHVVGYTVSFIIFGFMQAYMILNLIYLTKRLVDFRVENDNGSNYAYINEYYTDLGPATIITAGIAVFGVYFAVGLLALDPWHLFTSYAQFLFVSSAYINILNIFAFSNVHDVSWGQKSKRQELPTQEPSRTRALQIAVRGSAFEAIDIDSGGSAQDIDARYEEVLARALAAEPVDKVKKASPPATSDSLMEFRTILLATYIFSNFFICLIVLNDSLKPIAFLGDSYWHKIRFFRFWMWANSISYLLRFTGSLYYYTQKYRHFWFRH
ncbi:chitin synthase-domain-containing protein [Dactylonectria macrodidyma]|uniref:Chitin synthase n=1 Tax=Dactylonectria macrodidyma TaxID=307937 RepID=A0A9P9F8C2_9HYPO|nr:chitin synthase-domain-containing protein [Dactylonectria macrodidyma]